MSHAAKDEAFGIIPILHHPEGNQFLLIQHWAGHWGFPKGHPEAGETPLTAACREFEEETGVQAYEVIEGATFLEQYYFTKDKKTIEKTVIYFPAWVKSKEVTCQEKEIQNYCWLTFEAALEKLTFAQGKRLLRQVQAYLEKR